ncbi:flagellar hook protein FlgE [Jannaschia pagri]|uniref:Flagellar hook protein FlgE n=1 Tax=Jannaschia pagri TaxID=2829797 RepID=A0ABQ4NQX5_9RHOB|nr:MULTISPECIES: flagellar hook-basal body complex protein [unclassified Jannaschia]GIT92981.1 flagellar hook protein FlgE [Jannaschia sp. AI_61]GIT96816.1 flagellar hook protein FlgE [Jannaschia sp. AI_62]
MTISSSLNAGVTGLNVNASRLATISDNIANSATFGYKRSTVDFHSLVLDQSRGSYSAGGVRVTNGRAVDQRGTLVTTNNPTDLAVGGRGMLPVTPISAVNNTAGAMPLRMTTTGSFRPDADGILRTDSGMALLAWPANQDGVIPNFPRDTLGGLEPARVDGNQFEGDATTRISLGVNLPATDTLSTASGAARNLTTEYYGNLGQSQALDISFTPTIPTAGDPASNEWTMQVRDQAQGGLLIGDFTVTFDDSRENGGTIASVTDLGTGTYDATTGLITVAAQSGPLALDVGRPLEARGLSQLSDSFAPLSVTKDGSPVGILASIDVDANGYLSAIYDTGFTKRLYQVPIVDVPNPNGLQALENQTYQSSAESGAFYLWDAGNGPVGDLVGYSREESAVDVASELTQLIQTQRAYNSNAKVIQTVDEMLQETTNIKR